MTFTAETEKYFSNLGKEIEKNYAIARDARKKGLDPRDEVEVPLALTMAAKVVRLIATKYPQLDNEEIINRLLELEKQYGALETSVSLKIAEEIAMEKFCKFNNQLEAMDAGIRVGFAYTTLGVVSSPIEGYTGIQIGKKFDGKSYIKAYFSGPIRSAGTTAAGIGVLIIDYIRQLFGYERYDPTEQEAKRTVTELYDYHERVNNLQYLPTEEEVFFIGKNMPIQITGEPTEKREVSNYKNLARIETDFIRGGFCLIIGEGLAQKAKKILRLLQMAKKNGFKINDWEWLEEYVELHERRDTGKIADASPTYIKDLVAGRPVFGHPGRGFRFRYGRSRLAGFSAVSIHPATMGITNDFIATGTQLKIEKPTKGCCVTPCDVIDGPIVKLKNGSVKKLLDYESAKAIYRDVEEIIYFGDILFPLGDVMNRNAVLIKPGYVEEWWALELEKHGHKTEDYYNIKIEEAIKYSDELDIPLHPKYIFYWTQITKEQFLGFIDWLNHSRVLDKKLLLPYNAVDKERFKTGKRAMELLGIEQEVHIETVILNEENTKKLLINLGLDINFEGEIETGLRLKEILEKNDAKEVLEIVNKLSKYQIKDKAGEFIGSRMGRPEKAKLRKLTGSPNVLFPVGDEGGRLRSVNAALEVGSVKGDFPFYFCGKCNRESIYRICEICNEKTEEKNYCRLCKRELTGKCELHNKFDKYKETRIDISHYFEKAREKLGMLRTDVPELIKGVRGTSSEEHDLERLEKGILRAKHNLCVNKDGTIRYDMTELPVSHFKPKEIEVSVEKLKDLGYVYDYKGKELVSDEQILELMPHDIIIPCNSLCGDEKADDVFMNVAKFLDELLDKFYNLPRFYNIKKREDLVGQLGVCMAPHNCAGVVCRIIGFSKVQGLLASPYMHAAMRRDCLGHDSYVSVKENGNWQIKKIGELVEERNPRQKKDFYGTLGMKIKDMHTWSNPGQKQVLELTKHNPRQMIKISLEDGRSIETTESHVFYLKGKEEMAAKDLKVGDKLMVSYKKDIEEKDIEEIFLPSLFEDKDYVMIRNVREFLNKFEKIGKHDNFGFRDSFPIKMVKEILERNGKSLKDLPDDTRICVKRDNVSLPIRVKFDENLLSLIGLYIAEGYFRENHSKKGFYQVYFSAQEQEVRDFIFENMQEYFGLIPTENKLDRLTYSSRLLYEIFKDYFGLTNSAKTKRIPSFLLNLKKEKIAALLRGYYEGDGSVSLSDIRVACDSVSDGLKHDLSFVLSRFGIFTKFYEYEKEPGPKVKEFYIKKNREIPQFKATKIIIPSNFVKKFQEIGFLSNRKNNILKKICGMKPYGMKIDFDENYIYPMITKIEETGEKLSYCFNVSEEHNFFSNDILVHNCDGDEAAMMLLLDVLINFSRAFLPSHRGGTQDAPLVLNGKIYAKEVDDQILDFELVNSYPLEMYEKAEKKLHSSEIKIEMVKQRLKEDKDPYVNTGFTHDCSDFNMGATCSSYKTLPTMQDKVREQMDLCTKLRSVEQGDVARLIIDRHFMKDLKGNLRKFSQQNFRCGKCNEIYRRPPLNGKCEKCGNPKLIFTISYGSIVKYMEPALDLVKNFSVPAYIMQDLELTKKYIESIFGRDTEKQESMEKWFG